MDVNINYINPVSKQFMSYIYMYMFNIWLSLLRRHLNFSHNEEKLTWANFWMNLRIKFCQILEKKNFGVRTDRVFSYQSLVCTMRLTKWQYSSFQIYSFYVKFGFAFALFTCKSRNYHTEKCSKCFKSFDKTFQQTTH